MRERLDLTIALDPRYLIILLVVALKTLERAPSAGAPRAEAIRQACHYWWAAGFEQTTVPEFNALLDEMGELGVLYHDETDFGFRLQSPSVRRLLGTPASIEEQLLRAHETLEPPTRFNGAAFHMPMDDVGLEPTDARWCPLTVAQEQVILRPGNRLVIVVGTSATLLEDVPRSLDAPRLKADESTRLSRLCEQLEDSPGAEAVLAKALQRVGRQTHKVVVLANDDEEVLDARITAAGRALSLGSRGKTANGTATAVIVVTVSETAVDILEPRADADRALSLNIEPLRRWEASGLRAISLPRFEHPFLADRPRADVLAVTGGWPCLVKQLVDWMSDERTVNSTAVARLTERLRGQLASADGAKRLLDQAGLTTMGEREHMLWTALIDYDGTIPLTRNLARDLRDLCATSDVRDAELAYRTLF